MVTCLGYYYCPLLPFITSLILVITFYAQYFLSLKVNFTSSNKTWIDSKTRTLYLIISFLAILISFIFYFLTITVTEVKEVDGSWCGPFPAGDTPISYSGMVTRDADATYWIFNAAIWAALTGEPPMVSTLNINHIMTILVASLVLSYYLLTMVVEQKRLKGDLQKEMVKSRKIGRAHV